MKKVLVSIFSGATYFFRVMRLGIISTLVIFIIAALSHYYQYHTINGRTFYIDFYSNFLTEVFSIAITLTVIEVLNTRRAEKQEFRRLVFQMSSPNNNFATEAVRSLRYNGWLDKLDGKSFWRANLEGAELYEASLKGADLSLANLKNANLNQAKLNNATLIVIDLEGAFLHGADLEGAELGSSSHTDFLKDAEFVNTNLKGAKFLHSIEESEEEMQIHHLLQARRLRESIMPDGTRYDGRFNLYGDIRGAQAFGCNINDPVDMADYYEITVEEYLIGQEWYKNWKGNQGSKPVLT